MNVRISSSLTLPFKVLVSLWLTLAIRWVVLVLTHHTRRTTSVSWDMWLWILGFAIVLWRWALPARRVEASDEGLIVSTYFPRREVAIPYAEILEVCRPTWWSNLPVTLRLRTRGPFGDRILFMPSRTYGRAALAQLRWRVVQAARAAYGAPPSRGD